MRALHIRLLLAISVSVLFAYTVFADSRADSANKKRGVTRTIPDDTTTGTAEPTPFCGTSSLLSRDQYPALQGTIVLAICGALVSSILLGSLIVRRQLAQTRELSRFIPIVILGSIITSYAWSAIMAALYPTISYFAPTRREVSSLLLMAVLPLTLVAMYGSAWLTSKLVKTEHR